MIRRRVASDAKQYRIKRGRERERKKEEREREKERLGKRTRKR